MGTTIIPKGHTEFEPEYFVPEWDPTVQLDANFFCRGRNMKREKYCKARAGQGTDHLGQGRCKNHGGSTPITHGRYSDVIRGSVGEHIDRLELETEKEKLDILPEATLLRAVTLDAAERWEVFIGAIIEWNRQEAIDAAAAEKRPRFMNVPALADLADLAKKTAEIVNMVHKQRAASAISLPDFYRLMAAMADAAAEEMDKLQRWCPIEKIDNAKVALQKRWSEIQLKA